MAYQPFEWQDGQGGGTPITAARLNHIEQGITEVEAQEGPQGPPGADGADGFPTEAQWDALVARVEALESDD